MFLPLQVMNHDTILMKALSPFSRKKLYMYVDKDNTQSHRLTHTHTPNMTHDFRGFGNQTLPESPSILGPRLRGLQLGEIEVDEVLF